MFESYQETMKQNILTFTGIIQPPHITRMLKVVTARISRCFDIKVSVTSCRQYSNCKREALTAENESDMAPFGTAPPGE